MGGKETRENARRESVRMTDLLAIPAGDAISALAAAFVMGATSSAHCLLMCGPLACAALPRGSSGAPRGAHGPAMAGYHAGRLAAYALTGALAGLLGGGVARVLALSIRPYLPWVMAAVLVAGALGLARRAGRIPGLAGATSFVARRAAGMPPFLRATAMGALTPLLPCGLLYGVLAAALAAGSLPGGAAVLGGFALGATPALLLPQLPLGFLRPGPRAGRALARALPLLAAAVLVVRALAEGTGGGTCH
jgi:sulfite exporter TauE/SafE